MTVDSGAAPSYRLSIPLPDAFRFTHEPLEQAKSEHFVGRYEQLELLLDRMLYSNGGAFLITGYRGVGKTSFVNQVLGEFERRSVKSRVVTIHLNLARPVTPVELMFLIIRCLYLQFTEDGLHREIAPAAMKDLRLAYNRTLMTIKQTRSAGTEFSLNSPEIETTLAGVKTKLGPLFGFKRTGSQGNETSYLTYEERAAEYDLIQLARRLRNAWLGRRPWWSRIIRRSHGKKGDLRILFVFDELDKIEDPAVLDSLFAMLKNVFTTSGLTFLLVAGKDVQERWSLEIGLGDSIYESVFAYDMYLPCLWAQARNICGLDQNAQNALQKPPDELETLLRALSFHGRGIPRRILRNFHTFVRWQGTRPIIAATAYEFREAEFYAGLEGILEKIRASSAELHSLGGSSPDADKRALGLYYLVDWVLQRGTREFTLSDAVAAYEGLNKKLVFSGIMTGQIEALLFAMLSRNYIEKTGSIEDKQFVLPNEPPARYYRLTRSSQASGSDPEVDGETPTRFGEYLPMDRIAKGGIGSVVRAVDPRSHEIVAVKYVRDPTPTVRSIFTNEADTLNDLAHDSIPTFRGSELEGDLIWIAMAFIDAASLDQILARRRRLSEPASVFAALGVAQVCRDLHALGYVYGDLKPSNILATNAGRLILIDFSTARRQDKPLPSYGAVGTPAYMAPELLRGGPSSSETDVYALGVLLYELVCGRRPYVVETREELLDRISKQAFRRPSTFAGISPALEEVILSCLKADPKDRAPEMANVIRSLSALFPSQETLGKEVSDVNASAEKSAETAPTQVDWNPKSSIFAEPMPTSTPPVPPRQARQSKPARYSTRARSDASVSPPTLLPPLLQPEAVGPGSRWNPSAELPTFQPSDVASLWVGDRHTQSTMIRYFLRGTRNRIGRDPESEIFIDDMSFSRVHAIVSLEGGKYQLMDAGSLNGTILNSVRLPTRGSVTLDFGDHIEIGNRLLIFQSELLPAVERDSTKLASQVLEPGSGANPW